MSRADSFRTDDSMREGSFRLNGGGELGEMKELDFEDGSEEEVNAMSRMRRGDPSRLSLTDLGLKAKLDPMRQ